MKGGYRETFAVRHGPFTFTRESANVLLMQPYPNGASFDSSATLLSASAVNRAADGIIYEDKEETYCQALTPVSPARIQPLVLHRSTSTSDPLTRHTPAITFTLSHGSNKSNKTGPQSLNFLQANCNHRRRPLSRETGAIMTRASIYVPILASLACPLEGSYTMGSPSLHRPGCSAYLCKGHSVRANSYNSNCVSRVVSRASNKRGVACPIGSKHSSP